MRTRTRTIPGDVYPATSLNPLSYEIRDCANGMVASGSYNAGSLPAVLLDYVEEAMQDQTGQHSPNRVDHRRKEVRINPDPQGAHIHASGVGWPIGSTVYPASTGSYGLNIRAMSQYVADRTAWPMAYNVTNYATAPQRWGIAFSSLNEDSLKEDCFEAARELKADVVLNLVEANQMWPSIKGISGCIGELAYHWGNIRKQVATASGAYLAWKFGISPILSDIEAIQKYLPKMKNDIDRHVKGDLQRFSSIARGTATLDQSYDSPSYLVELTYTGKVFKAPTVRYVLVVKPRANRYMTDFFKKADTVMSRFGTSPASLAWELIPFSFVADWFVDLRGTLRALDSYLGQQPYEVVGLTRSFSYHMETSVNARTVSPCDGSSLWSRGCGTAEFKHYERIPVSETPSWPSWKPRFGKNQAAVSAALIAQQLTKIGLKSR